MHRFLFEVVASKPGVLPQFTGHLVRATFLALVQKNTPDLAHCLHKETQSRPYSITPLRSRNGQSFIHDKHNGAIYIREGEPAKFAINTLSIALGRELIGILLKDLAGTEIEMSKTPFRIARVSVEALDPITLLKPPQRVKKFRLDFRTPTYFSIAGTNLYCRFPDPVRIFGNLAPLWNEFIAPEIGDVQLDEGAFIKWASKSLAVTGYNLRTRTEKTSQPALIIGFQGTTNFSVLSDGPFASWVHPLLMLSTFSNVGQGRTAGFGITHYTLHSKQ